jgi:DNA-binding response OmpR family regulator
MGDDKKLTRREQEFYDILRESDITPVPSKDLYHRVYGDESVDIRKAEEIVAQYIHKIRSKLGKDSIVSRSGHGYNTKEGYEKGLERMARHSSGEKE